MKYLSDDFAISPQITLDDLAVLKEKGVATIFCHRPDREERRQLAFEELSDRAKALGLAMHHHPVVPGKITPTDVAIFRDLYEVAEKPILAYCKSGARAEMLWKKLHPKPRNVWSIFSRIVKKQGKT